VVVGAVVEDVVGYVVGAYVVVVVVVVVAVVYPDSADLSFSVKPDSPSSSSISIRLRM
jgi:hypothetical protein